jgi:chorismate synthase
MGSQFGKIFAISTWGESHGKGIGVVIDGCPAGIAFDEEAIHRDLQRRKPGQSAIVTQRKEDEGFEVQSGVFEETTTGTPIAIWIPNTDQRSRDYSHIADKYRPSHADYTYQAKYGLRDYRGGGRSSARETAARVAAGAVAKMILQAQGIAVQAYVSAVGDMDLSEATDIDLSTTEDNIIRCPSPSVATHMIDLVKAVRKDGDTIGGVVTCVVKGCPAGLGEPVFDKLHADLGKAMMSINAVKGFEYGEGFKAATMRGSDHNDTFSQDGDKVVTVTNHSGGIQGGISNGMDINMRVAFKPVATIVQAQSSVNEAGDTVTVEGKGRHDPCVVPRAVPIVEAMAALVIVDHLLRHRAASGLS